MFELSLHILDLVQNSIVAGATVITIIVRIDTVSNQMTIEIEDNGKGMDKELLKRVTSPFTTTRTTRKVGLGIPMFKQLAESCAGAFELSSEPGVGTKLTANFQLDHVDLPPLGDLAGTMHTLVLGSPESPDFCLQYSIDGRTFVFDTKSIRDTVGGLPLDLPDISAWIGEYLREGIQEIEGGHEGA